MCAQEGTQGEEKADVIDENNIRNGETQRRTGGKDNR
jgi:hypothetical protein